MSENIWIAFLHHIGDVRDDFHHSSKKILSGTIVMTSNRHFWGVKPVKPNPEIELNMAKLSQFSMFGNCRNLSLDYIDDIKDDFYHWRKKSQVGANAMTPERQILGQTLWNLVMK